MPEYTLQSVDDGVSGEDSFAKPPTSVRLIPEDQKLLVEIVSVDRVKKPWTDDDGKDIFRIEFEFVVVGGEYDGQRIWQEVYDEFTDDSRCRLRLWTQEIFNQPVDGGFRLNTDDLVGKRVNATTGIRTWTKQDGTEGVKNTVKFLSRLKDDDNNEALASPLSKPPSYATGEEPF